MLMTAILKKQKLVEAFYKDPMHVKKDSNRIILFVISVERFPIER